LIRKKLFIGTIHHQRQQFSAAAPQPITAADPPPRRPAHQSHRAIDNSKSTPITANNHNQDISTHRFIAFNNPQPQQVFVFNNPNQCYKPSAATTTDSHLPAAAAAASTMPSPSAATTDH
jgi:hypothetical protein